MALKTVYLHAGMHKTGSTSIQHNFANNSFPNHQYAKIGPANHSVALYSIFGEDELLPSQKLQGQTAQARSERREMFKARLTRALKTCKVENLILSGEALTSDLGVNALPGLRDFLQQYVQNIRVVAYVRPARAMLAAAFQQKVKVGALDRFEINATKYKSRLSPLETVFGAENVDLVPYARADLFGGDVVLDFAQRIGAAIDPENLLHVNETHSAEATALMFLSNKTTVQTLPGPEKKARQMALRSWLDGFGTQRFAFHPDFLEPVFKKEQPELDWALDRFGSFMLDEPRESDLLMRTEEDLLELAVALKDRVAEYLAELLEGTGTTIPARLEDMLDLAVDHLLKKNA